MPRFYFLSIPTEPFICFAAHAFQCVTEAEKSPCRGKNKKQNRIEDKDLIGGEEVEARLVAFLSEQACAAAFLTGSKRDSRHMRKRIWPSN